jgi:hypothetical protein
VPQLSQLFPQQQAPHRVQFYLGIPQPLEQPPQIVELVMERAANDNHVIQIY